MRAVAAEEGVGALWKGITPGIHRQVLFGGLRIGLYEPVKTFYVGRGPRGGRAVAPENRGGAHDGWDLG